MVSKITRIERGRRRDEARVALPRIESLAQSVRVNDEIGSHITIHTVDGRRIDWWPGTRRWCIGEKKKFGSIEDLERSITKKARA